MFLKEMVTMKRMTEEKALLLLAGVDEALKKCDSFGIYKSASA